MKRTNKKIYLFLVGVIVFMLAVSRLFVLSEKDHDCQGEDCPVCAIISVLEKTVAAAVGAIVVAAAFKFVFCAVTWCEKRIEKSGDTLVTLKVKLSD
ncbi:MAG: hypothetical protein IJ706_05295 [Clostridia bacterium]|nr:hypothetical protein [Clostridia bacterium]